MGTIFVAYGESKHRNTVLKFAAKQAADCDHSLFIYHIQGSTVDSIKRIQEKVERVIEKTAPQVPFTVHINTPDEESGLTNLSKPKRLIDAILETDAEYEYVVMGDIERGPFEDLTHDSLTRALLETHSIPVMLVPVDD